MEVMGLHLPGAAFVNPGTPLRDAPHRRLGRADREDHPPGRRIHPARPGDRRACHRQWHRRPAGPPAARPTTPSTWSPSPRQPASISTGPTSTSSAEVPLLTRIYPNGSADVNHFHAAGGMGFLIRELLDAGLLHDDVTTVMGRACAPTPASPGSTAISLPEGCAGREPRPGGAAPCRQSLQRRWRPAPAGRQCRPGGDQGLGGQARAPRDRGTGDHLRQPEALGEAFKRDELKRDFIAVIRFRARVPTACPNCTA